MCKLGQESFQEFEDRFNDLNPFMEVDVSEIVAQMAELFSVSQ